MKDSRRDAGCVIDGEILSDVASQGVSFDIWRNPLPSASS